MPNWCYNRVTAYGDEDKLKEIEKIFESKTPFNDIFPMPDWKNTPNENGELPILEQHKGKDGEVMFETYNFPDGKNDDRWFHWNNTNWGTKWDITAEQVELEYEDDYQLEISFETAWAPPEPICYRLREMFKDLHISWFYDEPAMELAGYL